MLIRRRKKFYNNFFLGPQSSQLNGQVKLLTLILLMNKALSSELSILNRPTFNLRQLLLMKK